LVNSDLSLFSGLEKSSEYPYYDAYAADDSHPESGSGNHNKGCAGNIREDNHGLTSGEEVTLNQSCPPENTEAHKNDNHSSAEAYFRNSGRSCKVCEAWVAQLPNSFLDARVPVCNIWQKEKPDVRWYSLLIQFLYFFENL